MSELKCANAVEGEKHEGPFYEQSRVRSVQGHGTCATVDNERAIICYACAKKIVPGLPEPTGFTFRVSPK